MNICKMNRHFSLVCNRKITFIADKMFSSTMNKIIILISEHNYRLSRVQSLTDITKQMILSVMNLQTLIVIESRLAILTHGVLLKMVSELMVIEMIKF